MKRLATGFYKEFHKHRDAFGQTEYDVEKLIESAIPLLEKHLGTDAGRQLEIDLLRAINEGIEARENDSRQGNLFSYDAHMPLGDRRRVKRGRANFDQLFRRKLIVDRNQEVQASAWAVETHWLNDRMAALREQPLTAVVEDLLNEDGSIKGVPETVEV